MTYPSDSHATPGSGWAELVDFARRHSPYYRRLYEQAPERPAYLHDLPMVDPDDFWAAHRRGNSELLTGPHRDGMVFRSGGTTVLPKTTPHTREELRATIACTAASMTRAGLRPGDRVANLLSVGGMYLSFLHVTYSLRECPTPLVELPIASHTDLDSIARILREQAPTVICATTTPRTNSSSAWPRRSPTPPPAPSPCTSTCKPATSRTATSSPVA
ncbi:hypothetical protein [Streptomyces sp. NPDC023838]|uniref:hypothetical protein n=1 Tax=Streptomyces sp. NPDC023838 TaxID=3154325 RepID=UPI0033EFFE23